MPKGKIIDSPEMAKEFAARRWNKHRERQAAARQKVEGRPLRILNGLGFETVEAAPEHLQILAELSSGGDNVALAALKTLAAVGRDAVVFKPGQVCPTCGGASEIVRIELSRDTIEGIKESFSRDPELSEKYFPVEPLGVSKPDTPIQ
jgi:hypothetical protein